MIFKTPAMRISIALVLLTVNLHFLADMLGIGPDPAKSVLELRKSFSESIALQFSEGVEKGELQSVQNILRTVVKRNEDIRSAAIRTLDGKLLALAGEHLAHWDAPLDGKSTSTHVQVPVFHNKQRWATVEIRFAPLLIKSLTSGFHNSYLGLLVFIASGGFVCYFFVLKRTLRELDPTTVIPERVQKAFDVMQEGILILDQKEQIVMTNMSFANFFGKSPAAMIGLKGSELGWMDCQSPKQVKQLPWFKVMRDGREQRGAMLSLLNAHGRIIKFAVNATVVSSQAGKLRGILLTFDDITELEEKNFQLTDAVGKLQAANQEIKSKSRELKTMADCDPLTLCLNRRSLGREFNALFTQAKENGTHLSCLMVDIDFFKAVNDNHGHAVGDQVIKAVSDVLKTSTRDGDLVGRYGGEEFFVVLPKIHLELAVEIAERIRQTIEKKSCSGVSITVSLGVSCLDDNASNTEELINFADKALYAAKKGGRNRVVPWGRDQKTVSVKQQKSLKQKPAAQSGKTTGDVADADKLRRRVAELEGLLEKRTLELEHYEMFDFKTGMPTRSLFEDRIGHEIARAKRKNHLLAVLSMTIDTIRRVHETMGYKAAEDLVKACGQRLNSVLRENLDSVALIDDYRGMSSVSLTDQAELSILLTDITQVDHVTWVMKRMLDAFEKPFQIKGTEIYASAFFGVSIYPHDGQTVEELCRSASNACHYAHVNPLKDRYLFSSENLNNMAASQLKIESALHEAIQNDELQLHYQAKIDSATGEVAGFEALLRWQSATLGSVAPNEFIPVAERSGLIDGIGQRVLYLACRQLRAWMDMGLEIKPVAINLSGIQLRQQNLADQIQSVMNEFRIDNHLLELELTESSLVDTYDQSFGVLKQIREMGFKVTMDDFGTGYSSLSYLRDIPLTGLKIDRSFVCDIEKDENADKLIASIVSMAHGMGLEVVAEGVEEKYQADHLIGLGCEYLQGYYFSRPIPPDDAVKMLRERPMAMTG